MRLGLEIDLHLDADGLDGVAMHLFDLQVPAIQTQAIELALHRLGNAIVETHKELSVAQKQMGLGALMYGDGGDKPPSLAAERALRPVAAA